MKIVDVCKIIKNMPSVNIKDVGNQCAVLDFIESQQKTIDRVCSYDPNGSEYEPECNPNRPFYDHVTHDDYKYCPLCGGKIVRLD